MASAHSAHPHALAVPLPATGHINPCFHLCERLAKAGIQATLVTSIHLVGERPQGVKVVTVSDGLPLNREHPRTVMDAIQRLVDSVEGMKAEIEELITRLENPVTCIITDAFIPWTHDIARRFGLPIVVLSTHAAATDLVVLHGRKLRSDGFMPLDTRTTGDTLIDFIPGLPPASPEDIVPLSFSEEHPWLDYAIGAFERMLQAKWVLSSSFQAMEPEVIRTFHEHLQAKHYLPIGPLISTQPQSQTTGVFTEDVACLEWLDAREESSVLYVSYGSLAILTSEELIELVAGLENSQHSFLLAMRPSLVVDVFPSEIFHRFMERVEGRGHVVSWAPQLDVLTHSAVGAFLTHCGWNSTMESICAAVPMIAWPCTAEQNMNCKIIVDLEVGVRIKTKRNEVVRRGVVEETVRAVMAGERGKEMRKNVRGLSDELKKAMSPHGTSTVNFNVFYEDVFGRKV